MTSIYLLCVLGLQQEVTLSMGAHGGGEKTTGSSLQANYALRLKEGEKASLFGEVHFSATPNRKNEVKNPLASRDEASLFLTPGLRVSFLPKAVLSPFVSAGFGLGVFEESELLQNGAPFPGSRVSRRGAVQFGGGADFRLRPWLALRGDFRDFYADSRHNPIVSIGFQLRFGSR